MDKYKECYNEYRFIYIYNNFEHGIIKEHK